jgi:predicted MPP superfamily phosphohydrolase
VSKQPDESSKPASGVTRRKLLKRGLLLGTAGVLGYTFLIEPFWWNPVHLDLPIENLPSDLVGRTLVQISDLHIGPRVDEAYITKAVKAIASFDPDIVVITGDIVQGDGSSDAEQAARVLAHLPQGSLATLAILGNHDYGSGWKNLEAAEDVVRRLEGVGIEVLRNQVKDVGGLTVVGLDDLWAERFAPQDVLPGIGSDQASLVLSHNPDTMDKEGWGDWKGWVLSGHTHGGQCKPPFLPPPILPVENHRYTQGAFEFDDGRRLYINPGLGYLRQVRFNVRPEITVFSLSRA